MDTVLFDLKNNLIITSDDGGVILSIKEMLFVNGKSLPMTLQREKTLLSDDCR
eukprot:m.42770 g.42770  ORF g.42770 m.42770 type:complete len:53 (-) comp7074_c1_seq2:3460-3618(-)